MDHDPSDDVAFLGQKSVTIDEGVELATLGRLLAKAGGILYTSMTEGANMSVLRGYKNAGGTPVLVTKGLHDTAPWFLLYGDHRFIDNILAHWPNPKSSNHWQHVDGLAALRQLNEQIRIGIERLATR